jgi:hypothetical protein
MNSVYIDVDSNPILKEWIEAGVERKFAREFPKAVEEAAEKIVGKIVEQAVEKAVEEAVGKAVEEAVGKAVEEAVEKAAVEAGIEATANMLRRLMERKFGALPAWTAERLKLGSAADLESWSDRFVTAGTIEDVFPQP